MKKLHVILSVSLALAVGAMVAGCNNKPAETTSNASESSTSMKAARMAPGDPTDFELQPGAEQYRIAHDRHDYFLITESYTGDGDAIHDMKIMGLNAGIEAYQDQATSSDHLYSKGGLATFAPDKDSVVLKAGSIECKNGMITGRTIKTDSLVTFPLNNVVYVHNVIPSDVVFGVVDLESHVFMENLATAQKRMKKTK